MGRKYRALAAVSIAAALSGCTALFDPAVTTYEPVIDDIQGEWGQLALDKDESHCRTVALGHTTTWSLRAIGTAAGSGAAQNFTAAATVPPSAPLLLGAGAASGSVNEIARELGLTDPAQIKIFVRCLDARGKKSGAYSVIDPNL